MIGADYFRGRTCVVTGAASGIGFALSEALLDAGAAVCLSDRDPARLAAAHERLARHGGQVSQVAADVTDESQVRRLVDAVASRGLDFLFNNAGIGGTMPVGDATLEHWRRMVDVNLWGVVYGVRCVLPVMRRQGGGHIVNVASIGGLMPVPYQALYNTTKYAVVGFSESLRFELAEEGIAVSVACPGNVATEIWGKPILGPAADVKPPPDAIPAAAAATAILEGVARREGIIVLPEPIRTVWREYCRAPEAVEPMLREMARQRRGMIAAKGTPNGAEAGRDSADVHDGPREAPRGRRAG